jgi:hypothetical protein
VEFIALSLIVFVVAFGCGYGVRELIARVPLHGARNIRTQTGNDLVSWLPGHLARWPDIRHDLRPR